MKNTLVLALSIVLLTSMTFAAENARSTSMARANVLQASLPCNDSTACSTTSTQVKPGEGSPMPLCPPGQNCQGQLRQTAGEGSPMPLCPPGQNCQGQVRQIAGEGSPMPLCPPGHNCGDNLRQIAGEGSPMPLCKPDTKCDNKVRLIAGEGSPMPLCKPDTKCDDKVRMDDNYAWQAALLAPGTMEQVVAMTL